jgi:hypothetical protein
MIKGKGFRGALEYDLNAHKGHLLDSNMAGATPMSLAREFAFIRALRPNLSKAVLHTSISIHPDEKLTDGQWRDVAQIYIREMGFADNQYVVTRHTDTEHPHIHILANRITMQGEVVSDSQDYKRQEAVMRRLEREYGLKSVEMSKEAERKALTKGEVEHILRTGEASVRMRLQKLVDSAIKEQMVFSMFAARLAEHGVEIKLNEAKTGRVSGISFSLDGVAMKGSDLGKAYTWNSLQKRGLSNETGYGKGYESGQEKGGSTEPGIKQSLGRTGNAGNAPGLTEQTGDDEAERQRRIAENFARLEQAYQGISVDCDHRRSRSKELSR